jgi:hypothetical protein
MADFLGDEADSETFWRQVESNLRSGRVRMVFVADRIPSELRRIVEFLNEQMRPAEVLAVEVEQFISPVGMRTLVPKLVGATERAQITKSVSAPTELLSVEDWLARLAAAHGTRASDGAVRIAEWFRAQGYEVGTMGSNDKLYVRIPTDDGKFAWPFFLRSNGRLVTPLYYLKDRPAFETDEARKALLERFRALPGVDVSTTKLTGWVSIPASEMLRDELWRAWIDLATWIIAGAKRPRPRQE